MKLSLTTAVQHKKILFHVVNEKLEDFIFMVQSRVNLKVTLALGLKRAVVALESRWFSTFVFPMTYHVVIILVDFSAVIANVLRIVGYRYTLIRFRHR